MTTPTKKTTTAKNTAAKTAAVKSPAAPKAAASQAAPAPKAPAVEVEAPKATPAPEKVDTPAVAAETKVVATTAASSPKAAPQPEAIETSVTTFEIDLEKFSTQLQEGYNEMFEFGKEQMEKFFKFEGVNAPKSFEDAIAFSKENVEAFVKSSSIATKGVQDVATLVADLTKAAVEGNVEASKKVMACKTPQEVAELQTSLLKSGYDQMIANMTRISEASSKIAEEAVKPLKERFDAGVEKLNEKAA